MTEFKTKLLLSKDDFELKIKSFYKRKIFELGSKIFFGKKQSSLKCRLSLLRGFNLQDIVFECSNSLECLMDNKIFFECPDERGKENCLGRQFVNRFIYEAPTFWELVLRQYDEIKANDLDPRLLSCFGVKESLEMERRHFLTLLVLSLGTLLHQNNNKIPFISEELIDEIGNEKTSFEKAGRKISKANPLLAKNLSQQFQGLLLSKFSQRGILFLCYLFWEAVRKSKPIPKSSEKLFSEIKTYMKNKWQV